MGIIKNIIVIIGVSVFIYFVKNYNFIIEISKEIKQKNNKLFRLNKILLLLIINILIVIILYLNILNIFANIKIFKRTEEFNKRLKYADSNIYEENIFYNEIIKKEYDTQNYNIPYIPKGFKYVEGKYDTGLIIEDENENQYVWVPCTNSDIEGIEKLQRKDFVKKAFISKNSCYNENYKEFLKSALENGGFYISRFEIGKENSEPVSKYGAEVWQNVNRDEANEIINQMYSKDTINCSLINGYAYDTTLEWINNSKKIEIDYWNSTEKTKLFSGRNKHNEIYDLLDNVLELTLETSYDTVIVRGFFSYSGVFLEYENEFNYESRYSIERDNNYVGLNDALAFRTILYK